MSAERSSPLERLEAALEKNETILRELSQVLVSHGAEEFTLDEIQIKLIPDDPESIDWPDKGGDLRMMRICCRLWPPKCWFCMASDSDADMMGK